MLGQRLFVSGLVLTGLFALGHLSGFLHATYVARHDPNMKVLTSSMREHKTRLLGFEASLLDYREYFSLNFTILLLFASAVGFAALANAPDAAVVVRTLSPVYVAGMTLLLVTSLRYKVAQGVVTCPMVAVLFMLAWWQA